MARTHKYGHFDVGANDGSICKEFRDCFPQRGFLPSSLMPKPMLAFWRISHPLQDFYPHNCALSSKDGLADFFVYPDLRLNSLEPDASYTSVGTVRPKKIAVKTQPLIFCWDNEVAEIGILKIDTEGHDLEVLRV